MKEKERILLEIIKKGIINNKNILEYKDEIFEELAEVLVMNMKNNNFDL